MQYYSQLTNTKAFERTMDVTGKELALGSSLDYDMCQGVFNLVTSRVEIAKMHYQDRLNQEKIDDEYLPFDIAEPYEIKPANTADLVLRLKNRPNSHVYVSTAPTKNKSILSGSRPCKFNESGDLIRMDSTVINEMSKHSKNEKSDSDEGDDADNSSSESESSESGDDTDTNSNSDTDNSADSVTAQQPKAQNSSIVPAVSAPVSGRRVGFGAIASLPPREAPSIRTTSGAALAPPSCDDCLEELDMDRNLIQGTKPLSKRLPGEDEDRIITESGRYEELSDASDDESWNAPGELDAEALEAERNRQKQILMALLQAPSSAEEESSVEGMKSAAPAASAVPPPQVTVRPDDIRSTSASAWGAPRFDPFAAMTAGGTAMEALKLSREEVALRRARGKENTSRAGVDLGGAAGQGESDEERARFADLDRLKGIFHREVSFA
jgi:hypothetical protein